LLRVFIKTLRNNDIYSITEECEMQGLFLTVRPAGFYYGIFP